MREERVDVEGLKPVTRKHPLEQTRERGVAGLATGVSGRRLRDRTHFLSAGAIDYLSGVVDVRRVLPSLMVALGCVQDDWNYSTTVDAGGEVVLADATGVREVGVDASPVDAPDPADAPCPPGACGGGCGAGRMRCGGACVAGPANLYRGDGTADDIAGRDDGTSHNGVGYARGRLGDAFVIDGAHQYVSIPPEVGNFGDGDFTIALWFSSTRGGVMLSKRESCWGGLLTATGEDINLTNVGRIVVEVRTSVGLITLSSPPGLNDGLWHHAALVRRADLISLDVDGADGASMRIVGSLDDPTRTPTYLGVGRCVAGAPGANATFDSRTWFVGRIDEVAFYPRALSRDELTASARGLCGP